MVLNPEKNAQRCLENFDAVSIHPVSKGWQCPLIDPQPEHLRSVVYMATLEDYRRDAYGIAFILPTFKPLQNLENNVTQAL